MLAKQSDHFLIQDANQLQHINTLAQVLLVLKRQCIGIKAMQSHIISQPVKSLLNVALQKFVKFILKTGRSA